ncbi:flagellar hook-length control protein FliK [Rhodopirellula bahusiensis]|uniref:flagellar hook-length control protein FliK n=1 Tax=Rhodopirellula bahusiensis TaxID=2014065 RepID=UPI001E63BA7A|nr:flagellar hook-length control protein FliK [Rhodopirellula bahusiensis]
MSTNKRAENAFAALGNSATARVNGLSEPTSGLGDPFAEIFARIATTETAVASESSPATDESLTTETDDRDDSSDDDLETRDDAAAAAAVTTSNHQVEETQVTESAEKAVATSNEENESSDRSDDVAWTQKAESSEDSDAVNAEQTADGEETLVLPDGEQQQEEVDVDTEGIVSEEVSVSVNSNSERRSDEQTADASAEETTLKTDQTDRLEETSAKESGTTETEEGSFEQQSNDQPSQDSRRTERRRYSREDNGYVQGGAAASTNASSGENGIEIDPSLAASGAEADVDEAQLNQLAEQAASKTSTPTAAVAAVSATTAAATSASRSASSGTTAVGSTSSAASTTANNNDPTNPINTSTPAAEKAESKVKAGLQASGTDQTSAVARAKMVQRVSRGFQTLGPNGGHIRMRLSPVELGSVQLEVHIQENNLRGRMVTESEAASQLLREHLPQLRSQLESQGMRLESIEITTDPNGASEFDQTQNSFGGQDHSDRNTGMDRERYRNRGNTNGSRPRETSADTPVIQATPAASWMTPATGVDLKV